MPELEVSVTLPPRQKVVAPPAVIEAVGNELTVTVVGADVADPCAVVAVTTKDPEVFTEIDCVVAPVLQR